MKIFGVLYIMFNKNSVFIFGGISLFKNLPVEVRKYIYFSLIGGFSFTAIISIPSISSLMEISIENIGWIFSISYVVQAFMSYLIGRRFEDRSPNYALAIAKLLFSFGTLLLAIWTNLATLVIAQLMISFNDIFYPSLVMYERAIIPPRRREEVYSILFVMSEFVKSVIYFLISFLLAPLFGGIAFYRVLLLVIGISNIILAVSFLKVLPIVNKGKDLHKEHINVPVSFKVFMSLMIHQYLMFVAFNFASFMVISYYLFNVFKLGPASPILFEAAFSITIVLFWPFKKRIKTNVTSNFVTGSILLSIGFLMFSIPNMYTFFLAQVPCGIGFIFWFASKETIKMNIAPQELGRWEGFFQGLTIFTKIFIPVATAYMVSFLSYSSVFITASIVSAVASVFGIVISKFYNIGIKKIELKQKPIAPHR